VLLLLSFLSRSRDEENEKNVQHRKINLEVTINLLNLEIREIFLDVSLGNVDGALNLSGVFK
jgi:hypothetical protein